MKTGVWGAFLWIGLIAYIDIPIAFFKKEKVNNTNIKEGECYPLDN